MTIDGDAKVTFTGALTGISTIDASKAAAGTSVIIDTGIAVKFTGGAGNDTVNVGAAGITVGDLLDAGAGAGDRLITSQAIAKADGAGIKGFELLDIQAAVTQDVDALVANNTFTQINIGTAGATVNNINAGAINNITMSADDVAATTLTGKGFIAGGITDTATLILNDEIATNGVDLASLTFANVDVLNIVSNSGGTPDGLYASDFNVITTLEATDLDVINVSGDEGIDITLGFGTTSLTVVDASTNTGGLRFIATAVTLINVKGSTSAGALGGDYINASGAGTAATIQGNAGGDVILLNSAVADTVKFVAGTDSIVGVTGGNNNFDIIQGLTAASASVFDISAIGGFTGSQATILDRSAVGVNANVTTATLGVDAGAASNWFVDLGNINRGVVIVDLDGTGGASNNYAVYVDANHNGAFDAATDLAFRVNLAGGPLTAAEFVFA